MRRTTGLLALILAGCAPASAIAPRDLGVVAPEQRFEIFTVWAPITADSVRVVGDTLFAAQIALHPSAPRSPVALQLVQVDSLRRAHTDQAALTSTLAPAAFLIVLAVALSGMWGND